MCKICETKPVYEFTNGRKVCGICFVRWFQKKVLYTIKRFSLVKKGEIIGYSKKQGFRDVVLEDILTYYHTRAPVSLVKLPNKKADKIAVSSTTDSEAIVFISGLLKDKLVKKERFPLYKDTIKPLYLFTDQEVLIYAGLRKLKFKQEKNTRSHVSELLNNLELKHLEIKHAIISGILQLKD